MTTITNLSPNPSGLNQFDTWSPTTSFVTSTAAKDGKHWTYTYVDSRDAVLVAGHTDHHAGEGLYVRVDDAVDAQALRLESCPDIIRGDHWIAGTYQGTGNISLQYQGAGKRTLTILEVGVYTAADWNTLKKLYESGGIATPWCASTLRPLVFGGGAVIPLLILIASVIGGWRHDERGQLHGLPAHRLFGHYHGRPYRHAHHDAQDGTAVHRGVRPMVGNSDTGAGSMGDSRPLPAGNAPRLREAKPVQRLSAGLARKPLPMVDKRLFDNIGGEGLRRRVHGAREHENSDVASVRPIGRRRGLGPVVDGHEKGLAAIAGPRHAIRPANAPSPHIRQLTIGLWVAA